MDDGCGGGGGERMRENLRREEGIFQRVKGGLAADGGDKLMNNHHMVP